MAEENQQETQPLSREEWIERVMQEGKDEVIRQEMIRMGFWSEKPIPPEEKAKQEQEDEEYALLTEELNRLKQESEKLGDIESMIRERRKQRIEESKRKRAERKAERERLRAEARKRWEEYKSKNVIHVGAGFSKDLQSFDMDEEKLRLNKLPVIRTAEELAGKMGISLSELKWLTYHRDTATICHYHRFTIPKKSGGMREISAPKPKLRRAQEWVKTHILGGSEVHPSAYGFIPGRSTVDNAKCHLKRAAVIKMDLKDFFPSITFWRVKGLFQSFGYSAAISTLLALLCTEPPRKQVQFDGKFYYVAIGERQLPQGACTSPGITNLLCRRLDLRLTGLGEANGFTYSRYADDLTFSCDEEGLPQMGGVINTARHIIRFEGFRVNEEKTRVLRSSRRQKVTGIVLNEKVNISRKELRAFRALLHNVEKTGPEKQNIYHHPDFWGYIKGYASYIRMVRPDLNETLEQQLNRINRKYNLEKSAVAEAKG
ncbi:reverse transcriptase domain-containing protein [Paenactinomyces guangxiensis]|uniref:RNA-directed DNA polymerase n=1 Tax=Paenactinomyces guangxiensis TaxID=1490290 RepID=A0A7W1WU46_9BACL|nr:reverse transcriptase family protein [Paenactinomyces guangxiensis]MBA4496090.1 RNA-directed DNA polymerase [Paenactinomyces guangxiensis]MBH8593178.1 hypothetical protein [Paenactinomyces guangxiensis]